MNFSFFVINYHIKPAQDITSYKAAQKRIGCRVELIIQYTRRNFSKSIRPNLYFFDNGQQHLLLASESLHLNGYRPAPVFQNRAVLFKLFAHQKTKPGTCIKIKICGNRSVVLYS